MPAKENYNFELLEQPEEEEQEIDLVELFYRLLEKAVWIVLAALVGAAVFGLGTYLFVKPTYRSTAKLYVVSTNDSAINLTDLNLGDKVADDFVQVFKNRDVYDQVVVRMRRNYGVEMEYSYEDIQKMMGISVIDNTRILQITVNSPSPEEAEQIATAYAETAKDFIAAIMSMKEPADFEKARLGTLNDSNLVRNIFLGFILGAAAAVAVIVLLFIVDDRIRTAEQLQKRLGLPALGMMPVQESERKTSKRKVRGEQK